MPVPNIEDQKQFQNFVKRVKESHSPSTTNTIFDLNEIVSPFYNEILKPMITGFNSYMRKEFGEKAPHFKVISNIEFQNPEQNRTFMQVLYQEKPNDFNLLTSPFFMIECELSGVTKFIISTFKEISEIDRIENVYKNHAELKQKFQDGFGVFLERML